MAGAQFEYDESGATAYYFFISFLAMIIIPMTYFLWPIGWRKDTSRKEKTPERHISKTKTVVLLVGWSLLAFLAYRMSYLETETIPFDPYEILEVDRTATESEIRRQYKKLSLKYHPDKEDGDPERFIQISKAYDTLTNEDSRLNWEMYGNPDGPGAVQFGIALPAWIVEKKTSFWVLVLYIVAIVIVLPAVVGTWWYKKVRYAGDDILVETMRLYEYYLGFSSQLNVQRLIMIVGASREFWSRNNTEIAEREQDITTIESLIKKLGNVREKNREPCIRDGWSLKARTLLHAYFARELIPVKELQNDQIAVLLRCPALLREMLNITSGMTLQLQEHQKDEMGKKGKREKRNRRCRPPGVAAVAACIKLSQMIVQAAWDRGDKGHPMLMLPYVTDHTIQFFRGRKTRIRGVKDFVLLLDAKRRELLQGALSAGLSDDPSLTDEQYDEKVRERYDEVMAVCQSFPDLHIDIKFKVLGESETEYVTTNSLVTVVINLQRKSMQDLMVDDLGTTGAVDSNSRTDDVEKLVSKSKPWEKNKKKKVKKAKPPAKAKKLKAKKAVANKEDNKIGCSIEDIEAGEEADESEDRSDDDVEESHKPEKRLKSSCKKAQRQRTELKDDSGSQSDDKAVDYDKDNDEEDGDDEQEDNKSMDDDEMWEEIQREMRPREKILHDKSTETHLVHAPYFPKEKQEWWWVYLVEESRNDVKMNYLRSMPKLVTSLKDEEEIELKFGAPSQSGKYKYTVWVRSDCYIDFDQQQSLMLEVHKDEGQPVENGQDESRSEPEEGELSGDGSGFSSTDED
ncbi:translocation protein SEC63 homolog [Corticium candelabrum]|uniref:translocation protein SEC63 homolog n=1 Tax=Corticium candelabrum TaxID=121492 RepID=UPI002E2641B9|nr:translocation protein SEC63 homolog [Corticium candelabrum]